MKTSKRKICVITGTRAEYGHLFWLLKELAGDPTIELQLAVTGMHLSPDFGLTYKTIEADGFRINEKIESGLEGDTPVHIAKSIGITTIGFADALDRLKPDLVVLLGDRFELLAAAQAAMVARLPIAHIHGGESSEGVIDEPIRHSLTKMSQFHFVAAEAYRKKVIQLGESPDRVFNFGAPGLDHVAKTKLLSRDEFEKSIDFKLGKTNFIVTYHPVTLENNTTSQAMTELLAALDQFPEAKVVFTKPNSDTFGRIAIEMIDQYVSKNKDRAISFVSLGQQRYLSALKHVDCVIGNSSSGLIETPMFKKPTINLGNRQKGRLKATSVIDCLEKRDAIKAAIDKGLSKDFSAKLPSTVSLYGAGDAALKIKDKLKTLSLEGVVIKHFHEI